MHRKTDIGPHVLSDEVQFPNNGSKIPIILTQNPIFVWIYNAHRSSIFGFGIIQEIEVMKYRGNETRLSHLDGVSSGVLGDSNP